MSSISITIAHEWYDPECCSGVDCRPVPCNAITYDPLTNGYNYHVDEDHNIYFYKWYVKPSQDNQCHACFHEGSYSGRCLYMPGMS